MGVEEGHVIFGTVLSKSEDITPIIRGNRVAIKAYGYVKCIVAYQDFAGFNIYSLSNLVLDISITSLW